MLVDEFLEQTIVHFVAHFGSISTMRCLVEHFMVDIFTQDRQGKTAIHYANNSGEIEMLSYICSYATQEQLEQ
jgi:ankyrin repeat protein